VIVSDYLGKSIYESMGLSHQILSRLQGNQTGGSLKMFSIVNYNLHFALHLCISAPREKIDDQSWQCGKSFIFSAFTTGNRIK